MCGGCGLQRVLEVEECRGVQRHLQQRGPSVSGEAGCHAVGNCLELCRDGVRMHLWVLHPIDNAGARLKLHTRPLFE